jgi:UDP-3-O-[3-hydroxymyristoyl] glucosamine N-acyltransferase
MDKVGIGKKRRIPESVLASSKLERRDGFGAVRNPTGSGKCLLINDLVRIQIAVDIGATRALERCMSAFHMTS